MKVLKYFLIFVFTILFVEFIDFTLFNAYCNLTDIYGYTTFTNILWVISNYFNELVYSIILIFYTYKTIKKLHH